MAHSASVTWTYQDLELMPPDGRRPRDSRRGFERKNIISERGIEGAPDLVIEILSTSTERTDREVKRKLYADGGVREYWIVDPRTSHIEVLSLSGVVYEPAGEYGPGATATSVIFPFSIAVDAIFADD